MSISNYTQLKTAISTWLKRTNITAYEADLVTLGEARINRNVRLSQQITRSTITMTIGQNYDTLPTGFVDVLDFHYNTDQSIIHKVPLVTLEEDYRQVSSTRGQPYYYAIGNRIEYDYPPDTAHVTTFTYIKKWDIASDTTNWLLTNHPDVYLYSCLAAAEAFTKNDERVALWKSLADEAIAEVQHQSREGEKAELMTEFSSGYNGNILTDF